MVQFLLSKNVNAISSVLYSIHLHISQFQSRRIIIPIKRGRPFSYGSYSGGFFFPTNSTKAIFQVYHENMVCIETLNMDKWGGGGKTPKKYKKTHIAQDHQQFWQPKIN